MLNKKEGEGFVSIAGCGFLVLFFKLGVHFVCVCVCAHVCAFVCVRLHKRMTVRIISVCVRVCWYVVETVIDCDMLYRERQQQQRAHTDVMRPVSHPIMQ